MILLGDPITAQEAWRLGLVNRVVAGEELENEVEKFGHALLTQSAAVLALARKAACLPAREALESALRESERIYLDELLRTQDALEGLHAFLEKRPPSWRGK
jgi:enoyl-CoA hydratase/carnithine racemase